MRDWIAFQIKGDSGDPLVFLHGIGGDADYWRFQLDAFADRYRAIAWDMPGYGDSPPLETMSFAGLAEALLKLFDRLSIERAHLVGHAMGGMIAQQFAKDHQDRLSSLTLFATTAAFGRRNGGQIDPDWCESFLERRLGPLERGAAMAELAPKLVQELIGSEPDAGGLEQAILSMAAVREPSYRAAIQCVTTFDMSAVSGDLAIPTLLLAGEKDPSVPPRVMKRQSDEMTDARYEVLAGAGHLANLERPEAFNASLDRFLQSLKAPARLDA